MITPELLDIVSAFNEKVRKPEITDRERTLTQVVKLNEEVGELCEAVLDQYNWQRDEKETQDLAAEIADVLIVTIMLAQHCDIDVNDALKMKIDKINKRLNIT